MTLYFCAIFASVLLIAEIGGVIEKENLSTRSTRVDGVLTCNGAPVEKAYVRLFKSDSEDIKDALATGVSDKSGKFSVEGNTANYPATEANIDPFLKIYHNCGEEKKKGFRRVVIRYPRDFVTISRIPRRGYNIGILNLAVQYPGETRVDEIKGI